MYKYILHPGHVVSQHDGEIHYITAIALATLYQVPWNECTIVTPYKLYPEDAVHLYPREDGKYARPEAP